MMKWDDDRGLIRVDERLSLDPDHIRSDRMKRGLPFLDNHDRFTNRSVLGKVENNKVDGNGIDGEVRFSKRAGDTNLDGIIQDISDGILDQFSGGYRVWAYQITQRDNQPDDYLAIDWEPLEASVTPIAADARTGTRSDDGQPVEDDVIHVRSVRTTEENTEMPTPTDTTPTAPADNTAAINAAVLAARADMAKTLKRAADLGVDLAVAEDVIARGLSSDEATDVLIAAQKRGVEDKKKVVDADKAAPAGQTRSIVAGEDQKEKDATAILEYLGHRGQPALFPMTEGARRFNGMSMVDVCRFVCESNGVRTMGWDREDICVRAMQGFVEKKRDIGGMHTTSDFANAIGTGLLKTSLQKAYDQAVDDFSDIVTPVTFSDLRTRSFVRVGGFGTLRVVGEAQEYKRVTIGDEKEDVDIEKHGEIFALSLEAILNDDLSVFTRIPAAFGAAAKLTEANIVFSLFVLNPLMSDGFAVFSNEHGNIGSASAPDVTGITDARTKMRKQTVIGQTTRLGIRPTRILTPYKYETGLSQIMGEQTNNPVATSDIIPGWIRNMEYVSSDVLDAASTQKWYAVAGKGIESIVVARLEGQGPFKVMQRDGWNVDGVEWKVRHWFGAGIVDYRGLYYNPGV